MPALGRNEETSRLLVDAQDSFSRMPHERVAFAGHGDDLSAEPVAVRLFVRAGLDGHDMADHS